MRVNGLYTWGCCPLCALGVAARMRMDIEAHVRDALTGEAVIVITAGGSVSSLTPPTAVAWAGMRETPDGKLASAGCFKQAFFTTPEHLKAWIEKHRRARGKQVTIAAALAEKMAFTPEEISKACKIGECKPR